MIIALPPLASPALAQQQPKDSSSQPQSTPGKKDSADKDSKSQEQGGNPNDRIFGVIPNYTTVEEADKAKPLKAKGKFKMAAEDSFDPYAFPFVGLLAAINQAQGNQESWGQGAAGYAKRYGAAFGDNTIGNFMTTAVFPSLLRNDPRYYQLGEGGFFHRAGYAISRIFVTRTDSGHKQFNYSEIAGNAVGAGISNAYYPAVDRSLSNTLTRWGTGVMWDTLSNGLKEFWPDIRRKLRKK